MGTAFALMASRFALGGMASAPPAPTPLTASTALVEFVNLSTTTSFSFVPSSITVRPGAPVHLVVTPESSTPHTFVLSSAANFTIPASDSRSQVFAFLNAPLPLVNRTIPGTAGATNPTTFTPPALGTYEFLCEIPDHFQSGMHGFPTSSNSPSSSSSASPFTPVVLAAIGLEMVVVLAGAVLLLRRRPKGPDPNP